MSREQDVVTVEVTWTDHDDHTRQRPRERPHDGRAPADVPKEVDELIALLEATDWRRVPGVSSSTAAMFCRLLCDARGEKPAGEAMTRGRWSGDRYVCPECRSSELDKAGGRAEFRCRQCGHGFARPWDTRHGRREVVARVR